MMGASTLVAPLAGGRGVLLSSWRDVHEGARADLLTVPGLFRVDVRPRGDTLGVKLNNHSGGELQSRPAGTVRSFVLAAGEWDGPGLQLTARHIAFRLTVRDRTVEVSVMIGMCRDPDAGLTRISAQAILRDADA